MSGFGDGPKFRGDLADHLPPRAEAPPDRWGDRLRHAWPVYLVAGLLLTLWLGAMFFAAVMLGGRGAFVVILIAFAPVALYARVLQLRYLMGRDPDTGEPWPSREK